MKRILVLRHAKSSWASADLDDHDRPLNGRGERAAPRMGALIREQGLLPRLVVSSTARRAVETLERALRAAGADCPVRLLPELYLAAPEEIVAILRGAAEADSPVLVVGHNPGLEQLVYRMTRRRATLPTAALAVIDAPCRTWAELEADGTATLQRLWIPRELD